MSSISPAMTVKNTYPTSFSIQNLPQTSSDKRPVSFRTGLISIEVEKAVTAELMQNIARLKAGCLLLCFVRISQDIRRVMSSTPSR